MRVLGNLKKNQTEIEHPDQHLHPTRIGIYLVLILAAIFFTIPLYLLMITSLKTFKDVSISTMWNLPSSWSFEAIGKAFTKISPNFFNSVILTIPATILSAFIGSINGYILSHWKFRGSNIIFALILFGMFIPYQSILFPLINFLQRSKLYGSILGLIVTHVIYGIPITTLMFKNYYTDISISLTESAQIDGAGIGRIYTHIFVPISLPIFVVVWIWQFTSIWNEFLFAVSITNNPLNQPITVALVNLAGSQVVEWNVQMAGALLAAIPPLLLYIFLGKHFVKGIMAGSVKE